MNIIIVGCGNIGSTLAARLCGEGHAICVVDKNERIVNDLVNELDVIGVVGNGATLSVLSEAGIDKCRVLIATTRNDEVNMLCCMIGKKAGAEHTIARVSDPSYTSQGELPFIKSGMGISMVVNPQQSVASEIRSLLKFPFAMAVDSFARSRTEIISFRVEAGNPWVGKTLSEIKMNGLIVSVQREGRVTIPDGTFQIRRGDVVSVAAQSKDMLTIFKKIGVPTASVKTLMIVGGGRTAVYLTRQLQEMGIRVTIVDKNRELCDRLTELFPNAMVVCGDATNINVLVEAGVRDMGAVVFLTDIDEENVMLSLYMGSVTRARRITRIHRSGYDDIIEKLDTGTVLFSKYVVSDRILKYIRALQRGEGSEIESLYHLGGSGAEAVEFIIKEGSPIIGKPLSELDFKPGMLLATITHKGHVNIPNGDSVIEAGDSVILVTTASGIYDIAGALK